MFTRELGQTSILEIISIPFVISATIMFSILGYTILMLWICKKSIISIVFLVITVHPWNESNLDTRNNLHSFCYGHYNHVLCISTRYWYFGFARKAFLSTIFVIINVHSLNESNLDICNNLYCFCYGHYSHVLPSGIHDIDALDLQEKSFSFHYFPYS